MSATIATVGAACARSSASHNPLCKIPGNFFPKNLDSWPYDLPKPFATKNSSGRANIARAISMTVGNIIERLLAPSNTTRCAGRNCLNLRKMRGVGRRLLHHAIDVDARPHRESRMYAFECAADRACTAIALPSIALIRLQRAGSSCRPGTRTSSPYTAIATASSRTTAMRSAATIEMLQRQHDAAAADCRACRARATRVRRRADKPAAG